MAYQYFDSLDFDKILDDLGDTFNNEDDGWTSQEETSSNSDSNDVCAAQPVQKKARKEEKVHVFRPRVLKNDVRKNYATMFANIMNSLDFPIMFGFFDTYFTPEFKQHHPMKTGDDVIPHGLTTQGIAAAAKFWCFAMQISPDFLFQLKDTRILYSPFSTNSKIVSIYSYGATKLFKYNMNMQDEFSFANADNIDLALTTEDAQSLTVKADKKGKKSTYSGVELHKLALIRSIQATVDNFTDSLQLCTEQIKVYMEFTLTMHLNEKNMVTAIVMET